MMKGLLGNLDDRLERPVRGRFRVLGVRRDGKRVTLSLNRTVARRNNTKGLCWGSRPVTRDPSTLNPKTLNSKHVSNLVEALQGALVHVQTELQKEAW